MKIGWSKWPRRRQALGVTGVFGGLMCALAFVPSPQSVIESFATVAAARVSEPPDIVLRPALPIEQFASIAERPLFNPDRKPDPEPPPPEAAKAPTALGDLAQVHLVGLIGSKDAQLALVRRADSQIVTLRAGDVLDGWKVAKIDAEGVALDGGDRQDSLKIPVAENRAPPAPVPAPAD
jgi:general secretion pathway protein N